MKKTIATLLLMTVTLVATAQDSQTTNGGACLKKYEQYTQGLPFQMAAFKAPIIPEAKVVLTDFGAIGDGTVLCTDAFAKAIDQLYKMGGGHLIVPRGVWLTGPIVLRFKKFNFLKIFILKYKCPILETNLFIPNLLIV